MRLQAEKVAKAIDVITSSYGDHVGIWLFGSRVDDKARGGDVDLYVESDDRDVMRLVRCKRKLVELFDLKVDLVVGDGSLPIHRIAKATGIRLK